MSYYKTGTYINLKAQAQRQKFLDEVINGLFWTALGLGFIYCLYA